MISQQELDELVNRNRHYFQDGTVAHYIPALAKVRPDYLGVSIYDLKTNQIYSAGDSQVNFAIESISKVPVLLLAMNQKGINEILQHIDTEPTGFPFNSILNMVINHRKMPMNPFVNIGAIYMNAMLEQPDSHSRFKAILDFMKTIMNNPNLTLNDEIYSSESRTGDINRSLAYYLKGEHILAEDVDVPDILDSYFRQCSVNVNTVDLAHLGALLANGGVAPWNDQAIIEKRAATITKSIMTTAGLYDESGDFSTHVGVPAKSGVGGGLLAAVPHRFGIGIFGPALDVQGNSVAGMKLLQDIVQALDANIFE